MLNYNNSDLFKNYDKDYTTTYECLIINPKSNKAWIIIIIIFFLISIFLIIFQFKYQVLMSLIKLNKNNSNRFEDINSDNSSVPTISDNITDYNKKISISYFTRILLVLKLIKIFFFAILTNFSFKQTRN